MTILKRPGKKDTFGWRPTTFMEARKGMADLIAMDRRTLLDIMNARGGSLPCPAPADDSQSAYQVGINAGGVPELQRKVSDGPWLKVSDRFNPPD